MTNKEFKEVCKVALDFSIDLSNEDVSCFDGCGLRDFIPIVATVRQCASGIRWQCLMFNGGIDNEELNSCHDIFRRKITLV